MDAESRVLHKAVVSVLARALECGFHPPLDFAARIVGNLPGLRLEDSAD
jgi:hypothetical protein